jgi:hypothetical protein
MSFIRIKNKSVVLATSYREAGKVKQSQRYLGKAEMIKVDSKKLGRLFDWAWSLFNGLQSKIEDIDTPQRRTPLFELRLQNVKKNSEKLYKCLAGVTKNMRERNSDMVHTKDLYEAILRAEEIIQENINPPKDEALAISNEIYKMLKKPYRNLTVGLIYSCPMCHRPYNRI